jgi:hypothetical protein
MNIRTIAIAAGALALGLATWNTPSKAQGPLYDRVNVNLPYSVTIGDRTLQPGDYVIQQLRDAGGNSRVLLIYSDNGMKFETSAMTIPALDPSTPENTKVILHHFGPDYYFDKIWIQGKDYGYEFPLPDSVKARQRERMEPISVAANYQSTPESAATTSSTTTSAATTSRTTTPAEQATTTPATSAPTTPAPVTTAPSTADNSQNTMPQTTTAQNTTPQSTMPQSTMAPATAGTANRDESMPHTSAGWLMMLLGGGTLSSAGMMLRRKR